MRGLLSGPPSRGGHQARLGLLFGLLLALSLLLQARAARAYDGIASFGAPAIEGGGGGRYFTGSIRDGHACGVCHLEPGARAPLEGPEIRVAGLPSAGYLPGRTYELDVYWTPGAGVGAAASLELLSSWTAESVGSMSLPPPAELSAGEFCAGRPATSLFEAEPTRTLAILELCTVSRMRLRWTAPTAPSGPVWLSVAVVHADGDGLPGGDAVSERRLFVPVANSPVESSSVQLGCSLVRGAPLAHAAAPPWPELPLAGLGLLAGLLAWRRRR
ncbi:MAG: hypothetical protein OEY14_04370 [Myxococcales bacterium]|nr:hypothetical protein [Myxococcales bacterium]